MTHTWVSDGDEAVVCNDCDCKRGSRASLLPCPACPHCDPPEQP